MRSLEGSQNEPPLRRFAVLAAVIALAGCHDGSSSRAETEIAGAAQHSVGVTVTGLNGSGPVLQTPPR